MPRPFSCTTNAINQMVWHRPISLQSNSSNSFHWHRCTQIPWPDGTRCCTIILQNSTMNSTHIQPPYRSNPRQDETRVASNWSTNFGRKVVEGWQNRISSLPVDTKLGGYVNKIEAVPVLPGNHLRLLCDFFIRNGTRWPWAQLENTITDLTTLHFATPVVEISVLLIVRGILVATGRKSSMDFGRWPVHRLGGIEGSWSNVFRPVSGVVIFREKQISSNENLPMALANV